ncbi:glyceraldehyde 3-phosphate dehydrogenase NAD-binding domain-containing protein [Desulfobulbus oligotrophicus]|jgi:glyceraldehyde 3-phosphate dehydrogenase|uniref:Glyceraldehyde-3-phosphate dehydrogenase n=1 Tax=Desulfobulbus oligotrophicus TaxID=1909699 RepID=A0A7T5VB43_9BACT|nr:glyceraldehyde 3-phosphate dehydrogenase NAD-binding domain-containing protein [Desulfobulbus oligotrophicus]MDY0391175.1 glyceraldehyde 3-phosphate dehydrogenase NAD-binding domain-containing protein [Desulfobulbus oligotrophicus]QQG64606.1 glyceraldehyde-3-phosphate dehydrogenase [Desulfobulbus oligotrophicus]
MKLGINGLGRIGKLSLWNHVSKQFFSEIIVNLGRNVGGGLEDIAAAVERDSTYGRLGMFLHGNKGGRVIENLNEEKGSMTINGVPVTFLRTARNPKDINWQNNQVRLVVDTTGAFKDPTADPDEGRGSVRGHLLAGAEKVMVSAPFKIQAKGLDMPEDAVTMVMGINDDDYDPARHNIISAASCTTTCLSYMIKPLLDHFGAGRILSASMVTVHAATGSQEVLDRLPAAGASDLRKNRSILNNIILTTTGAANALALVIPEMKSIGFIAESVRIPTSTGSLIVLVINLQDELDNPIKRNLLHSIYEEYSQTSPYLVFSKEQNVSSDIIGMPRAAVVIESTEIHTRTATIKVNLQNLKNFRCEADASPILDVPFTQAAIYGWYDNELGSYTNMLGELTIKVAERMV